MTLSSSGGGDNASDEEVDGGMPRERTEGGREAVVSQLRIRKASMMGRDKYLCVSTLISSYLKRVRGWNTTQEHKIGFVFRRETLKSRDRQRLFECMDELCSW